MQATIAGSTDVGVSVGTLGVLGYSTTGSSTHANVLSLIDLYKVDARPVATGGLPAPGRR